MGHSSVRRVTLTYVKRIRRLSENALSESTLTCPNSLLSDKLLILFLFLSCSFECIFLTQ